MYAPDHNHLAFQMARCLSWLPPHRNALYCSTPLAQVAMLTRGGEQQQRSGARLGLGAPPGAVAVPMPGGPALESTAQRPLAVAIGWVLRHRRGLLAGYIGFLHVLVYFIATMWSHCTQSSTAAKAGGGAAG